MDHLYKILNIVFCKSCLSFILLDLLAGRLVNAIGLGREG